MHDHPAAYPIGWHAERFSQPLTFSGFCGDFVPSERRAMLKGP
jgi:hypothetical protein